jgi:cytochrome c
MLRSIIGCACMGIAVGACSVLHPALAADDLTAAREMAISHCSQCHTFGKGEPHGQGPNLYGLIGREAGSVFGFHFSNGFLASLKGKTWDAALLDHWLTDTQTVAPGSAMLYSQDDPVKRAKLIRFLESLR